MKSELSNSSKDGDLNDVEVLVPGENKPTRNNANTNAFIQKTRNQNGVKVPSKKVRKHGNSSSTKPPQHPRHIVESVDENMRKSSRVRIARTPFQPESSTRKKGQENDREELKLAAASARDARQKACSNPFWQQTETLFAPITPEDLLLLKQPRPYEVHSGTRSQVSNDEREALDVIPEGNASTEQNLCEQGPISPASNAFKLSTVPSLHQRLLAALLDEDEIEHMDEIQSEDTLEMDLQSDDEQCEVDAGAHFMREYIIRKVLDLPPAKKVKMPIRTSLLEHEYQSLSLDDKLMLELQSIGINPDMPPEETEGLVEQEIKEHEEKLRQKGSAIKDKFMKIEKDIEHEQDFAKRSAEVAPFEKLVEIANRKLPAWRKNRFSKNPCTQKNLSFIARTLDRCKEFEETGRSCFSDLNAPCPTDKENVQLNRVNIASTDSTEASKISKAKGSAHSISVSGETINKTKRKRGTHNKPPSIPLQTPVLVLDTGRGCSSCSSELPSNQNIENANNNAIVGKEEEDESDREMTKRIRSFKRKKMTDVLASCSSRTTLGPTTKQQYKQQQVFSSSKTVPVENVADFKRKKITDVLASRSSRTTSGPTTEQLYKQQQVFSSPTTEQQYKQQQVFSSSKTVPVENVADFKRKKMTDVLVSCSSRTTSGPTTEQQYKQQHVFLSSKAVPFENLADFKRKKMTDVLASCSSRTTLGPTAEQQYKQQVFSSSKTVPVGNVADFKRKKMTEVLASCSSRTTGLTTEQQYKQQQVFSSSKAVPFENVADFERKRMTDVLASCSSRSTLSPTTEQQYKQQQVSSSSKTVPVENVAGSSRGSIEVMDANIRRGLGEDDGFRPIIDFLDGASNGVGLDVPMDNLLDIDEALWNGW